MLRIFSLVLICWMTVVSSAYSGVQDEEAISQWLALAKNNPVALRQFAQTMPKGADLHSHLSGAIYAEHYLLWGAQADYCVDLASYAFIAPPCAPSQKIKKLTDLQDPEREKLIERMSTKNFIYGTRPGHDQFFLTFDVFKPFSNNLSFLAKMLASVTDRAANQRVLHLELMITLQYPAVKQLGIALQKAKRESFSQQSLWLKQNGLDDLVREARADLDVIDQDYVALQGCAGRDKKPGCDVHSRWVQQVVRGGTPDEVFTQIMFAFELMKADQRVVGVNLVGPEDGMIALRDYSLHMKMLGFFLAQQPSANISLHAGELTLGLVSPEHLTNHITEAVLVAGAKRIGHGVAITYEKSAFGLMQLIKERDVLVEICLTSNDLILGVTGNAHPLSSYLAAGVPVTLASDDEGVSRIDLSHEYQRSVSEHGLSYRQLKQFSRASLSYSFLPGANIWQDRSTTHQIVSQCQADHRAGALSSVSCREFLAQSEKAQRQWQLEMDLLAFEKLSEFRSYAGSSLNTSQ